MGDEAISKADKSRIKRLDNIDSAFAMLFLVNNAHTEQIQAFPKELILAICWEESFFQNIPQDGGPAVGYGQLESSGRRIANQHFTGNPVAGEGIFNSGAILGSRDTSVRAISHCLAGLFERLGESQLAALGGYAGVKDRPQNALIIPKWKACADELQKVLGGEPGTFDPLAFENALRKAREFETSGPVYEHIHSKLWPLVDVLSGLVSQVQIGSQGPQVTMVQDSLNRFQSVDTFNGLGSLPLDLDGDFGPKTKARVQEFQSLNHLDPDGVVGPLTRGTIKSKAQSLA